MEMNKKWRFTRIVIVILSILTAGISIFYPDVYRDKEFVINAWFGNDLLEVVMAIHLYCFGLF